MPHVLSAVQLSSELGLWPLYRHGIVVLGEVLLAMEGTGMAKKAFDEVESVWPQVSPWAGEEPGLTNPDPCIGRRRDHRSRCTGSGQSEGGDFAERRYTRSARYVLLAPLG